MPNAGAGSIPGAVGVQQSSEYGTNETVTAKFWPLLEPFFRHMSPKYLKLFLFCPAGSGSILGRSRGCVAPRAGVTLPHARPFEPQSKVNFEDFDNFWR